MILPPPTTAALLYARNELRPERLSWRPLSDKATRPTKRPGRRVKRGAGGVRRTGDTVTVPCRDGIGV